MSDCTIDRSEFVLSLEGYPRVYYFSRRLVDLKTRFKRINEALPQSFQDFEPLTSDQQFCDKSFENKHIHLTVIGSNEISVADLCYGNPSNVETVCTMNIQCPKLIVCTATLNDLGEVGLRQSISLVYSASKLQNIQRPELMECLIILCSARNDYSVEECEEYGAKLMKRIQTSIPVNNCSSEKIIISTNTDLKKHITSHFEVQLAHEFMHIHSFLEGFMKTNTICSQIKLDIMPNEVAFQSIKEYLNKRFSFYDVSKVSYLQTIIARLSHVFKCVIIAPLSLKFSLPYWVCNRLLHEIRFEEALEESVSPDTKYYLRKFKQMSTSSKLSSKSAKQKSVCQKIPKNICLDLVVKSLLKDFNNMSFRAEKVFSSMKSITTVMGKMMFEIEGYLKQTTVSAVQHLQIFSERGIPNTLRKEIMAINGVHGMGTLYGQLEIHLDVQNEVRIKEISERVRALTKKTHFPYSVVIRSIEK